MSFGALIRWVSGVFVTSAVVVGGAGVFLTPVIRDWAKSKADDKIVRVRVEPASRGTLVRTVSAPGAVEPKTKVQISSRISAKIVALPFREGDSVKKGDVVVRLDDRDLQASLHSAEARMRADEARLEGAKASYVNAVAEWERISALFDSNDVSKQDLDSAEATRKQTKSTLEAAQHSIEASNADVARMQENLSFAEMHTPIDGRVTRLNAEVGEVVVTGTMNNQGTVILEIGDLSEMLVKAEVDESDIAPVRVGQKARVYINAYPDEVFEGIVQKIALQHSLTAERSKYFETEILLALEPGRTLLSGLTANVEIEVELLDDVILLPSQAVVDKRIEDLRDEAPELTDFDDTKTFVQVVYVLEDEDTVAARPVRIGVSDLTRTAILSGLDEGERVVVGPWAAIAKLKHHEKIRLATDDASKSGAADNQKPTQEGEAPPTTGASSDTTTDASSSQSSGP